MYELQGYIGEEGRTAVYAVTAKMGYNYQGVKLFEYHKNGGESMFRDNKTDNLNIPIVEEFKTTIQDLPGQIVSDNVDQTNYIMSTDHLTPKQKEESVERAIVCAIPK